MVMAVLFSGCGDDDAKGHRFGEPDQVRSYRDALNPIIDQVSAVERQVHERAVGSSNVATAANLNAVYMDVRPMLLETLVDFDRLAPPRKLADLHQNIRSLIILRLDAYRLVMQGYATADSTLYSVAEGQLAQANDLILDVNLELCEIDIVLGDLQDCRLLAIRDKPGQFRQSA